jgi:predicted nucleotide-binding protein (sugar kinase/HSP70/actin superfamily)
MGKYYIPIKKAMEAFVGNYGEVILPPPITKRTIELGALHSPDFVCVPFKYTLGNFIEALENGANVLFQIAGDCRLGFYSEVQEQILQDLDFDFTFHMMELNGKNAKGLYEVFKAMNPELTLPKVVSTLAVVVRIVYAMDGIEKYIRQNIGFEVEKGGFERIEKQFLAEIATAETMPQAGRIFKKYLKKLKTVALNKPAKPLRVGVVGELYVLMEPFSNYFIEKELAKFGIEVERFITASYLIFSTQHNVKKILKQADGYVSYEIGADGTDSVAKSVVMAKKGYDGIIHLKPFGCTPEVNSIPMVNKISEDFEIPVLYFSFDAQTSETGVKTRLEAFYDMLEMKKRGRAL